MKKVITIAALLLLNGINAINGLDCNEFNKEPEKKMLELLETESLTREYWNENTLTTFFTNNLSCLQGKEDQIKNVKKDGNIKKVTLDYYFRKIGRNEKTYAIEAIMDPKPNQLFKQIEESSKKLFHDWKPLTLSRIIGKKDYRARWILTLAQKNSNHCKDLKKVANNDRFNCDNGLEGGDFVEIGTGDYKVAKRKGKRTVWAKLVDNSKSEISLFSIVCIEKSEGACSRDKIKLIPTNDGTKPRN